MSSRIRWATAMAVLAAAAVLEVAAAPLKEGDPFPDLKKAKLEGALPNLSGKVVLVDFWASWCGPCKQSFPAKEKIQREYADRGFVVVAISVDEAKENMEAFLKDHEVRSRSQDLGG